MSEQSDLTQSIPDSVMESVNKMPASQTAPTSEYGPSNRFLTKDKTVHQLLGGGLVADSALWRDRYLSGGTLGGSTLLWILLEKSGYTFLTLVCNILLFVVVILFVWSNVATLINRPGPPVPELSLSENFVMNTANLIRIEVNKALHIARTVALGKDFKLFLLVVASLYVVSIVGSWFNLLTCVWIGIVWFHVVPFIFDKYEDVIDHHAQKASEAASVQYRKLDDAILRKIPRAPSMKKRM
ncbi:reticulon-like protein B10 [Physcomitrium patens]|uniref:Reticulon-like protein n=1 Tax=Physcomitrium patens TaxID=3218 RepID=A9RZ19_PHYPA|nr:reticulon-like protein B10 [Physcomitrium patens]XP_024392478.1 reticulon-like protein B10 [Physcomitrium patens]XP_024392479.1 reticulon-like protein B10 [Physcomitrium patens]PNR42828.1 hypothetical protein PHYPA_017659 [Physcomitrium patens]|eukprot:XP_024392477.1 reticulon-like protein B10 [Physcomitrella patens]